MKNEKIELKKLNIVTSPKRVRSLAKLKRPPRSPPLPLRNSPPPNELIQKKGALDLF